MLLARFLLGFRTQEGVSAAKLEIRARPFPAQNCFFCVEDRAGVPEFRGL